MDDYVAFFLPGDPKSGSLAYRPWNETDNLPFPLRLPSGQKRLIALLQLAALCFGIYFRIKIIRILNEFVSKGSGQTVLRSVQQQ